jgi:hypothetical protein
MIGESILTLLFEFSLKLEYFLKYPFYKTIEK